MKTSKLLIGLAGAAILATCHTAVAEDRPGAITLSPGVGAYLFDSNREIKNTPIYNLGLGYDFNRNWSVEALAGTLRTNTKGVDNQSLSANLYSLDGIYHFNINKPLTPYLLAGAGVLDFNTNVNNNNNNDTQANLNAGAGLEYFLNNSFALRSDIRDIYTMANGKSDVLINFGVSVLLGGQAPSPSSAFLGGATQPCYGNKVIIRFADKSTTIDPIYKAKLQQLVTCMLNNPNLKASIDGYANSASGAKSNLLFSQRRAEAVKNYLINQAGINPGRIIAQGFGEANSVLSSAPPSSVGQNSQSESAVVSVFGDA